VSNEITCSGCPITPEQIVKQKEYDTMMANRVIIYRDGPIGEIEQALQAFCNQEYSNRTYQEFIPDKDNFTLYAEDCGGYDGTDQVTFRKIDDKFFLCVEGKEWEMYVKV
jgi:hypothetical protein